MVSGYSPSMGLIGFNHQQERTLTMRSNRVRAGISPALPTPPSMRVRTRRLKQGNENEPTDL